MSLTQKPAERLSDEVVAIALRTLPKMLVSADGPFCLELAKDNRKPAFDRDKSWRYTVMCLLGLARAQSAGLDPRVNVKLIFDRMVALMPELGAGEIGLLLWLAVRLNSENTAAIAQELTRKLDDSTFESFTGMEIAWIMTGSSIFGGAKGGAEGRVISRLLDYFFQKRVAPSGLVYHLGGGARRRFPNFATQIYSLHALAICARYRNDARCGEQAARLAALLSSHQRDNGGWPWLYDAKTGGIVEPFEIYSVHQHGMAPMAFFEFAETTGKSVADTISKSMAWLKGQNELGFQMIAPENGLIYRSIRRRFPDHRLEIYWRVMESLLGWKPGAILPQKASRLEVNYTCRPYELGWLLEAWGGTGAALTEDPVETSVKRLAAWLDSYGELSQDVDDYFNNRYGRWAKSLYYKWPVAGTIAVAPLVLQEALVPFTRRFFWPAQRFPLADAHFAMGFAYLCQATQDQAYYKKAAGFLDVLVQTRCPGRQNYCWGYPFGWETVWGNFPAGTPLITTTPYGYEAFEAVHEIDGNPRWLEIMRSVADHALKDYKETEHAPGIWASSYSPLDKRKVVNANAYRAFLLTAAAARFSNSAYAEAALRPLAFVLNAQQADGSWLYALDGWDSFIDHYHTCFVMKALAKILRLTGDARCAEALQRGVKYYLDVLIDSEGLPRPFAKPPRLVIYRRELYDLAEAVNLAVLLGANFPLLQGVLGRCVSEITGRWQLRNGAYRTRKLLAGWNNVPMHRWGLSIAFRSLCLFLRQQRRQASPVV